MKNTCLTGRIIILSLILTVSNISLIIAQETSALSDIARGYYDNIFGVDQRLVSGDFNFGPMGGSITGHPFFIDDTWKEGKVLLDSNLYTNLLLRYDIFDNQLIMRFLSRENSPLDLSLNKNEIERFWLGSRMFVPSPRSRDSLDVVFCEMIVEGVVDYIILKTKEMVLNNGTGMTDYGYKENLKQYLFTGDQLIPFHSKRTLYRLDPVNKKKLKSYIRQNKLILKRKEFLTRARLINYYNTLLTDGE